MHNLYQYYSYNPLGFTSIARFHRQYIILFLLIRASFAHFLCTSTAGLLQHKIVVQAARYTAGLHSKLPLYCESLFHAHIAFQAASNV